MRPTGYGSRSGQRGVAALLVVVVLFFILAMVTAYAGRNLIFEQRTAVNNTRAAQAFEMAETGIEFAIAMLGSGRVDDACLPTTDVTKPTFRQRHMTQDASGNYAVAGTLANLRPTCMLLSNGHSCSCPAAGAPDLVVPVGLAPTFQLQFQTVGIAQPGVVRVVSRGCNSIGNECYTAFGPTSADAVAEVSVLLGLNSALATPPSAALTARGSVDLNGAAVAINNADVPTHGITIDSGGPVVNSGNARLSSVPGTPGTASIRASDPSLSTLDASRMFVSLFGMDRATYRSQPAAVRITCAGDCGTEIARAASDNPGRVIWVEGPATIDSNLVLGTVATPVMLAVQGNLTVSANLTLHGVLYLHDASQNNVWTTAAGSTLIDGAVVAESNLSVVGAPAIAFDPAVLRAINLTQGSMVRIPGSWRDFAAGS